MHRAGLVNELHQLIDQAADQEMGLRLGRAFDPVGRRVLLDGFDQVEADEGTLWIVNPSAPELLPVFNSGPHAADFTGRFRQPLDRGVVSLVFHSGQPYCENDVGKNQSHDRTIDETLKQVTSAMIAVPLFFGNRPRGVVSCVRLESGEFEVAHLQAIQRSVTLVERLIDWQLLQILLEEEVH